MNYHTAVYFCSCTHSLEYIYRMAQNVGGGKHWRIWRLSIDSLKFSHPNIVNTLKYNGKPSQFAKVLPSNYTSRVISPKFPPANILRYTVSLVQNKLLIYITSVSCSSKFLLRVLNNYYNIGRVTNITIHV